MRQEQGPSLARGVVIIVVTGVVLGLAFNALGRSGRPQHGLAWLRQAERMEKLEDVAEATTDDTMAEAAPDTASAPGHEAAAVTPPPVTATPHAAATSAPATPAATPKPEPTASRAPTGGASKATEPAGDGDAAAKPAASTPTASTVSEPAAKPTLPVIPDVDHPLEVELSTFKKFFDANGAAIVDARDTEEYTAGHVAGARSIPFDDLFSDPTLLDRFDPGGKPIICYCSGPGCDLSMQLAQSMLAAGFKRVLVFEGGYPAWEGAGYPVARGPEPGGS